MHIILYWQRLAGSLLFFSKAPFYSHYQQCVMSSMAVDINLDSSFFIISLHAIVAKSKAKPNKLHTRAHTNTTYCCTYLRTTNWIVLFFSQDYVVFIFLTHAQQYIEWCCTSNSQFEDQRLHLTLHTTLRALCRKAEKLIFGCNCELLRNNYSIIKWHHLVNIREALHIKCMSMKIRDELISAVFSATLESV